MCFVRNLENKNHIVNISHIIEVRIIKHQKIKSVSADYFVIGKTFRALDGIQLDPTRQLTNFEMPLFEGTFEQCEKYIDKFFIANIDIDEA